MPDIKLGSLFDGIGVFPLAASRCGIRPVWASEIEKAPISITKRHFPDMAHLGDITKVDGGKIPPVHVITFGSPCQNLSLIGNRSGLAGAKSSLFYQAFRIIQEMRDAMVSTKRRAGICRRSSPSRQILILCWATPSRAESRKRSVEVMKTRSKAMQILRAMLARRYGFGASPNKQRPGLCGHGGIACRFVQSPKMARKHGGP